MIERTKYTNWLDVCWDECEKMWEYVSNNYVPEDCNLDVIKGQWLEANGYKISWIRGMCFFCEFVWRLIQQCNNCPGVQVDNRFGCFNLEYNYETKPKLFYKEIVRLNKVRKERTEDERKIT